MQKTIAVLQDVSVQAGSRTILSNINLTIHADEQWAIVGASGSGKTTLAHALAGMVFHSGTISTVEMSMVEQQHRFKNRSNTSDFYYQQRYNSSDAEDTITVEEALQPYRHNGGFNEAQMHWIDIFHLAPLLREPLIQLSNGENKRLQLVKALMDMPSLLILDNPFIGLDAEGRQTLHNAIDAVSRSGVHIVLITAPDELPGCITHVALLEKGRLISTSKKENYLPSAISVASGAFQLDDKKLRQLQHPAESSFRTAIKMVDVTVQMGDRTILQHIHWEVKKGECWSVSGPNGAGKSTLLSLVTADNPQAYANEIYLFDQRRGRGESIWDIKRRIGFVSPELHLYFGQSASCTEVIASGLFDTIGLFRQLSDAQEAQVARWIDLLRLQEVQHTKLWQLSPGRQRMVLLARALVKNPPLLILDEPCQGLDMEQTAYFKSLIDQLCRVFHTTLVYVSHYGKDLPQCVSHFLRLAHGRTV